MAKWQKVVLHQKTAEAANPRQNTITVDLPEKDFLSQILVKIYKKNKTDQTTGNQLLPVFYFVKRLEVVDGSDVLFSLSGTEAQAIAYYRGRTNPAPNRLDWENTETWDTFYIRFNRFPGDTKYLLNCAKLANPQLKITYDNTVTNEDGYDHDVNTADGQPYYTVVCDVLRGTPPGNYTGKFISAKEFYTWHAKATAHTEYVDVPRTDPIFGIAVRSHYTAKGMSTQFCRVRLNINNQEWVPFDLYYNEMEMLHAEWFEPFITVSGRVEVETDVRYNSGLGELKYWNMIDKTMNTYHYFMQGLTAGQLRATLADVATGTLTAANNFVGTRFIATGLFPQHTIYLPMSVVTDTPEEVLDAPSTANIILEVFGGVSSASAKYQAVVDIVRDEGR